MPNQRITQQGYKIKEGDVLVIVDLQNDFCPGGTLGVPEGDRIVEPINRIIAKFPLVIATQDWHPRNHCSFKANGGIWPEHCVQETRGAELHPDLKREPIGYYVRKGFTSDKDAYSGFDGQPDIAELLKSRNVSRIFIAGLATDYCVRATVLDGLNNGFDVIVLTDAIRGVDVKPGDSKRALGEMESAGARLITIQDIL